MLEFRRKWNKQVSVIRLTDAADEAARAVGFWAPGVRSLIIKAYLIIGADIAAAASASVSNLKIELFDRAADGSGVTLIGTVNNDATLADDIKHTFIADGYVVEDTSVIGIEYTQADFATSAPVALTGACVVVEYIPFPAV